MKQLHFFIVFIFISLCADAQSDTAKLIGLHPAVGKTISHDEKIKYHLFPEYNDSSFYSAQVFMYNDTTYLLQITKTDGYLLKNRIGTNQLDDAYNRVEEGEKAKDPNYGLAAQEEKEELYKDHQKAKVGKIIGNVLLTTLDVGLYILIPRYNY